jgi:hypothetical protein
MFHWREEMAHVEYVCPPQILCNSYLLLFGAERQRDSMNVVLCCCMNVVYTSSDGRMRRSKRTSTVHAPLANESAADIRRVVKFFLIFCVSV